MTATESMRVIPEVAQSAAFGFPESEVWLLAGVPRVGKSTFGGAWCRDVEGIYLELEPGGAKYVDGVRVASIRNLDTLRAAVKELREVRPPMVVLDSLDEMARWIARDIAAKHGCEGIGDIPYGGGWHEYRDTILQTLDCLRGMAGNVVAICHTKALRGENGDAAKLTLALEGRNVPEAVISHADEILFATMAVADDGEVRRELRFHVDGRDLDAPAGCRHPRLNGHDPIDLDYAAFRAIFEEV